MKPQSTTPQPEAPAPKKIDIICYPEGNTIEELNDLQNSLIPLYNEWAMAGIK